MDYILIIVFCLLSILFSILIITSKNPIHSVLYLILVFCCVAFIFLVLGVEFLSITILIVYVGAIAVLFLFVVMMLNIKILELEESFWKYVSIGFAVSIIFFSQIIYITMDSTSLPFLAQYELHIVFIKFDGEVFAIEKSYYEFSELLDESNSEIIGQMIYTFNFPLFFAVSWILLIAMIGTIVLVLNQNINVRRQKIFRQTSRNLKSSVKMKKRK